jgi:hypothetical protein
LFGLGDHIFKDPFPLSGFLALGRVRRLGKDLVVIDESCRIVSRFIVKAGNGKRAPAETLGEHCDIFGRLLCFVAAFVAS